MMPIAPPRAPNLIARRAMMEAGAARTLRRPAGLGPELMDIGGGERAEGGASDPLPVYSIPISMLAKDSRSRVFDAVQHGWRVRTVDAQGEQLVDLKRGGAPVAVRRGASTEILDRTARLAEEITDPKVSYEARILDFGQLGLSALWLHRRRGADRFFVLGREPQERNEQELIEEAERRAREYLRRRPGAYDKEGPKDIGG